jgi:hypothetical protein
VQRPHLTVVALGRDQCAGVVGDPAHRSYADLRSATSAEVRPSDDRARARPSASSASTKPHHLPEAIAALELKLTDDEAAALEKPYSNHGPS